MAFHEERGEFFNPAYEKLSAVLGSPRWHGMLIEINSMNARVRKARDDLHEQ